MATSLSATAARLDARAPADYDCNHSDLLYVYQDAPNRPQKAIYFDNEGHVIHYDVSTPGSDTVVFRSDPKAAGPRFRLIYDLKDGVMEGKFQLLMPGKADWVSYLEWSGRKQDQGQ